MTQIKTNQNQNLEGMEMDETMMTAREAAFQKFEERRAELKVIAKEVLDSIVEKGLSYREARAVLNEAKDLLESHVVIKTTDDFLELWQL